MSKMNKITTILPQMSNGWIPKNTEQMDSDKKVYAVFLTADLANVLIT